MDGSNNGTVLKIPSYFMFLLTLTIVAILLVSYLLMSTESINHLNRAAIAIISGVAVWVLYMWHAEDYINLIHAEDYKVFLADNTSTTETLRDFISTNVVVRYIAEACHVILFLITTNTILETLHNNGVFDPLTRWLRMRDARVFLWTLSLLTCFISANVDNFTTVVLMMGLMSKVVRSHYQRVIFASAIMVAATVGGCITVIGDMTSLLMWTHGVVSPTAYSSAMAGPCLVSLAVFNLLASTMLHGRVEIFSIFSNEYNDASSSLAAWQKTTLLVAGIVGLWSIPTFHSVTRLPAFLGAMCVLAVIWVIEGFFNLERNGNVLVVNRHYFRSTEFIGVRTILYFVGVTLGISALAESGTLSNFAEWLNANIHNVYIYGCIAGIISSVVDNVPLIMTGINMFDLETAANTSSDFTMNGTYWLLLSYCCSMGGALLFVGTMAGQAILQVEGVRFWWFVRHYTWRVLLAWVAGMGTFWIMNSL